MVNILRHLSIRNKLLLISLFPILGLFYFLQNSVQRDVERKRDAQRTYDNFVEVEKIADLIHQVQIERGLLFNYLVKPEETNRAQLHNQQQLTDQHAFAVKEIYAQHHKPAFLLATIDTLLQRKDDESYLDVLNILKAALIREISVIAGASENPKVKNHLDSYLFLIYSKEYLARIRTLVTPAILTGSFTGDSFERFVMRKGVYESNTERFMESAPEHIKQWYAQVFSTAATQNVLALVDSVYQDKHAVEKLDADEWWMKSSSAIDLLKNVEDYSLGLLRELTEVEMAAMDRRVIYSLAIALLVLILLSLLSALAIRQIVEGIYEVKTAAEKLIQGDVEFDLKAPAHDETGELVAAFKNMMNVTRQYAHAAENIGRGDYSVAVKVRSESDVLGKALNNMKENLQRLSEENSDRTWLLTGHAALNDKMQGDKDLDVLAEGVITQLTEYLNAQVGALYVRNNGKLNLTGSYAFPMQSSHVPATLGLGEGLAGLAAKSGEPKVLAGVPDDYIKIGSALGNSKPKNLLIYPFVYDGEVKGVAEIGSFNTFSALDLSFMDLISNNVGVGLHAAQARERLKLLLEETQRQSQELQVQGEELKQYNAELQEKTEMLERSGEELKTQQEELQQTNEELGEKANQLEMQRDALEDVRKKLQEKANELELTNKYKTEFLANTSHELRTPLNSILILAQVLMENRNKVLGEKEIRMAETIHNSGADLLELINEILDLSKIEAGKMELDLEDFTTHQIAENIRKVFDASAKSKAVKFDVEVQKEIHDLQLTSDRQRVEQVLKNFLSNAFKFTEKGGRITFRISEPDEHKIFRNPVLGKAEQVVAFRVSDTGIGIAREKFDLIFEAFHQGDGSTKRKYGGTGLGLSISREITNLLGGEIDVQSEMGQGSSFTLYLPSRLQTVGTEKRQEVHTSPVQLHLATASSFMEQQNKDDQLHLSESDRKILIIENDEALAKILLEFIHERNYKGIWANRGNIGLNYSRHYKPDAIFLNMNIQGMNGVEVLQHLKRDPELRHIPVQMISAQNIQHTIKELGAFDFIRKPVTKESFTQALDKLEEFISRKLKKLLIIEDDQQHNEVVKNLIGNSDVICYSAFSGEQAFTMLLSDSFDCIILDLGLPDMSGFDFLERIKTHNQLLNVPIIVYTGRDLTKEENDRLQTLASTVVVKTVHSYERLLDETTLFLHRVEAKLPREKQRMLRKLHRTDEILKDRKVLIADDDVRNVYSLVAILEQEGLICITAENGKKALETLERDPSIDIVLMDVMMPEMDGYETTREIRKREQLRKLPIIGLTAKAMKGDREQSLASGMSDYISKPLDTHKLLSLMRVWLYR